MKVIYWAYPILLLLTIKSCVPSTGKSLIYKLKNMIIKTMIELFQGRLAKVQYVKYSNGKKVKRVLGKDDVPELIVEL
jgi:hypothetical protein